MIGLVTDPGWFHWALRGLTFFLSAFAILMVISVIAAILSRILEFIEGIDDAD